MADKPVTVEGDVKIDGAAPQHVVLAGTISDATPPPRVDCVLSAWGEWVPGAWSACVASSQSRIETRSRTVVTPASGGGVACGPLTETRTVTQACVMPPPATTESPGGTFARVSFTDIITDATGRKFTLGDSDGLRRKVLIDGLHTFTGSADVLYYDKHKPYAGTLSGLWYELDDKGWHFMGDRFDPTGGSAPPPVDPGPVVTPPPVVDSQKPILPVGGPKLVGKYVKWVGSYPTPKIDGRGGTDVHKVVVGKHADVYQIPGTPFVIQHAGDGRNAFGSGMSSASLEVWRINVLTQEYTMAMPYLGRVGEPCARGADCCALVPLPWRPDIAVPISYFENWPIGQPPWAVFNDYSFSARTNLCELNLKTGTTIDRGPKPVGYPVSIQGFGSSADTKRKEVVFVEGGILYCLDFEKPGGVVMTTENLPAVATNSAGVVEPFGGNNRTQTNNTCYQEFYADGSPADNLYFVQGGPGRIYCYNRTTKLLRKIGADFWPLRGDSAIVPCGFMPDKMKFIYAARELDMGPNCWHIVDLRNGAEIDAFNGWVDGGTFANGGNVAMGEKLFILVGGAENYDNTPQANNIRSDVDGLYHRVYDLSGIPGDSGGGVVVPPVIIPPVVIPPVVVPPTPAGAQPKWLAKIALSTLAAGVTWGFMPGSIAAEMDKSHLALLGASASDVALAVKGALPPQKNKYGIVPTRYDDKTGVIEPGYSQGINYGANTLGWRGIRIDLSTGRIYLGGGDVDNEDTSIFGIGMDELPKWVVEVLGSPFAECKNQWPPRFTVYDPARWPADSKKEGSFYDRGPQPCHQMKGLQYNPLLKIFLSLGKGPLWLRDLGDSPACHYADGKVKDANGFSHWSALDDMADLPRRGKDMNTILFAPNAMHQATGNCYLMRENGLWVLRSGKKTFDEVWIAPGWAAAPYPYDDSEMCMNDDTGALFGVLKWGGTLYGRPGVKWFGFKEGDAAPTILTATGPGLASFPKFDKEADHPYGLCMQWVKDWGAYVITDGSSKNLWTAKVSGSTVSIDALPVAGLGLDIENVPVSGGGALNRMQVGKGFIAYYRSDRAEIAIARTS